jgi:hypothetical protein
MSFISRFINWLYNKIYSCIYREQEYTRLENEDEIYNDESRFIDYRFENERSYKNEIKQPDPMPISSESESESDYESGIDPGSSTGPDSGPEPESSPEPEIDYERPRSDLIEFDSGSEKGSEKGSESNSITVESYKDDPIERVPAPSPTRTS